MAALLFEHVVDGVVLADLLELIDQLLLLLLQLIGAQALSETLLSRILLQVVDALLGRSEKLVKAFEDAEQVFASLVELL